MFAALRNRAQRRDLELAHRLHDEGGRLGEQGRWAEAESTLRQAVELCTRRFGADGGWTLVIRTSRVAVLRQLDRGDEALAELQALLVHCPTALGEAHAATAEVRVELASMLISRGRPAEAEQLLSVVLRHRSAPDRRALAALDARLRAKTAQGRHREAVDGSRELQEQSARVYGANDIRTLKVASDRVQNLVQLGEYEQVERECLALLDLHGTPDLLWLAVMNALVMALNGLGRHGEAEEAAREALRRQREVQQPSGHMRIALSLGLARSLSGSGRHEEALQVATRAEAEFRDGPTVRVTLAAPIATVTAQALLGLGRPEEAEAASRKAVELAAPLGPTHHSALEAATTLGSALAAQQRHTEARDQLTRCATAWRDRFGAEHPRTRAAGAALAALPIA
ncbi:tetratricopeptide repeat protein [Kitasatospora sp. NPDC085895]|uniref:tetratricopeptide repeat protein n=1 Tax=Kitasatospora sp. NPDC085895 TaxID=3155057 RepID=UPI00345028ED